MRQIRTQRDIPASAESIWAVLADFRRYAEWNTLNIWADGQALLGERVPMRFVDSGGGKGGSGETTVKKYSYFANFSIGLCEGPIARINRVWADGKPFNLADARYRLHRGTAGQDPSA